MANLSADFPAEVHKRILDDWLNANSADQHAVNECWQKDDTKTGRRMRPRGISVERDTNDSTAAFAIVRGFLWGENESDADDHRIPVTGLMHPLAFKRIHAAGTTARGIRIYG